METVVVLFSTSRCPHVVKGNNSGRQSGGRHTMIVYVDIDSDSTAATSDDVVE